MLEVSTRSLLMLAAAVSLPTLLVWQLDRHARRSAERLSRLPRDWGDRSARKSRASIYHTTSKKFLMVTWLSFALGQMAIPGALTTLWVILDDGLGVLGILGTLAAARTALTGYALMMGAPSAAMDARQTATILFGANVFGAVSRSAFEHYMGGEFMRVISALPTLSWPFLLLSLVHGLLLCRVASMLERSHHH